MIIQSKTIKIPPLFPWQKSILGGVLKFPHDIHIVKSKRQVGKSVTCEVLLLYYCINKMNSTSICISPTLNQSRKIFKDIVKTIQNLPIYKSSNATTLEINFYNNSTILLKSGEQQSGLRGYTCSGCLIFDEATFIPDSVIFECMPFADAHGCPVLLTSTPKFKNGCFYEWYKKATEGEKNFHYYDINEWDTSALLSPERLEMYRKSVAPQIFRCEYLGEFIEAVSELFGDVKKLVGTTITPSQNIVAGVDFGTGNGGDDTSLTIMNDHKEVIKCYAFNDLEPLQTIDFIIDKLIFYNVKKVVLESNSIGKTYISLLKKKISEKGLRIQVIEFLTTNQSKREIIESLQIECLNQTIQIPNDNKLMLEMVGYEMQKTPNGSITYNNNSNSIHDDMIISLALALYALKQGRYNIR